MRADIERLQGRATLLPHYPFWQVVLEKTWSSTSIPPQYASRRSMIGIGKMADMPGTATPSGELLRLQTRVQNGLQDREWSFPKLPSFLIVSNRRSSMHTRSSMCGARGHMLSFYLYPPSRIYISEGAEDILKSVKTLAGSIQVMDNLPSMGLVSAIGIVCFFSALYNLYRRMSRISIAHIPGPKPDSFLLGEEVLFSFSYYASINQRPLSRKLSQILPVTGGQCRSPALAYGISHSAHVHANRLISNGKPSMEISSG